MDPTSFDDAKVLINRPALNRVDFDELCEKYPPDETPLRKRLSRTCGQFCQCSGACILQKVLGLFPIINTVRKYKLKKYLIKDFIAGLSVGIIHIPQGMGFALLTGVPPVYGLYSSFFPVLLYIFLGSSRHISVGTMAIISILLGSVVERESTLYLSQRPGVGNVTGPPPNLFNLTDNSTGILPVGSDAELTVYKASVAAAVTLVSGGIMAAMGFLRLGIITTFMPTSFLGGFTTGAAFHITTSQMTSMLGITVKKYDGIMKIPYTWIDICSKLPTVALPTLIVSLVSLVLLIFFKEFINEKFKKRLPLPIPIEMLVLIAGTVVSYFCHFGEKWNIAIVGPIPRGIPAPFIPPLGRVQYFLADAIIIAVLSFAISISMADLFARKHKYAIDTNQELIANGLSYGLSSFFYCFIGTAAPPRCFVLDSVGGKTQVAGVFTALLLLLVLLVMGPLFQTLPNSVLSCIIVVALFPLFKQFKILPNLWRVSKADFSIWIITWIASIFLDLAYSLAVGIGWAIITVAITAMTASGYTLGMTKHQDLYAPVNMYKNVRIQGGVAIFRYECGLFFASIKNFKEQLFKATVDPQSLKMVGTVLQVETVTVGEEGGTDNPALEISEVQIEKRENGSAIEMSDNVNAKANGIGNDIHLSSIENTDHPQTGCENGDEKNQLSAIIIDCSSFAHVDFMGLETLRQLSADYKNVGIKFILAECTANLMEKLWAESLVGGKKGDDILIYPSIADALLAISSGKPSPANHGTPF